MMLRGPAALVLATAGTASMIAGCTFLISFDDVPTAADAAGGGPMVDDAPDVRVDAPALDAADGAKDAGTDVRDAIANPDACVGFPDGLYCGGDQISWPVASKDDLVTCKNHVVSNVRFCADIGGCIRMLNGFPDQCDECAKKVDGFYCGRDMGGWDTKNYNSLVHCQNKAAVSVMPCGTLTCTSSGAASSCK
ncbi:MAG: hypothetical protein NVS3B10_04740 [Polyangiales bacterium]